MIVDIIKQDNPLTGKKYIRGKREYRKNNLLYTIIYEKHQGYPLQITRWFRNMSGWETGNMEPWDPCCD